jgi:chromosome partitioning protein
VGKTATATALAAAFADQGYRTLLIDSDPQGSATAWMGFDRTRRYTSLYDVMRAVAGGADPDPSPAIVALEPTLHLLPAHINLAGLELELAAALDREWILHDLVAAVADQYDVIVLDTPPTLALFAINALLAADAVLIPQIPDAVSVQGLGLLAQTLKHLRRTKAKRREDLAFAGVVLTQVQPRTDHHRQYRRFVAEFCAAQGIPFLSAPTDEERQAAEFVEIPATIRAPDAAGRGIPLSRYAEAGKAAEAYRKLARLLAPEEVAHAR